MNMSEKAFSHPTFMELNSFKEDDYTITEEREEHMIPSNSQGNPTSRIAHFLKPLSNPKGQSLPKPPFHFISTCSNIKDLRNRFTLKGRFRPFVSWRSWVEDLQKTHESAWKKAGIFNAIKASTYYIKRDNAIIMCLAEKWCPETNTFVFPWGESTITLEDIMVLGGFSVMGNSVFTPSSDNMKFAEITDELRKSFAIIRKNCYNVVTPKGWLECFKGKGGELEHVAFLVLWLSRYVFCSSICIFVGNISVFDIAISLALGTKIALAPTVLASIYRDLTLLKKEIVLHTMEHEVDSSEVFLWSQIHLVQCWAWERFPVSSPKPASLVHGVPRMARWQNVRKKESQNLRFEIESAGDSFVWRPYVLSLKNWDVPKFYCDEGKWVVIDSEFDEVLLSFVRCLRGCELVGLDCVMQYSPHRVGMQFGMDQDIPNCIPRFNADYELAWSSYAKPMEGLRVYLPPRLFEGDVTEQYTKWWRLNLDVDDDDVLVKYTRRKRSLRRRKILPERCEGRRCTKDLVCSSFEGMMTSENPINVADKITSSTTFNDEENIVTNKEEGMMIDNVTSNTGLNGQLEAGIVAEKVKEKMVDDAALNEQGDDIGLDHPNGTYAQDIELSTKLHSEAVNVNQLGLEIKKLCSVLAKDHNQLGKDATDAIEVKHAYKSPFDDDELNDSIKYIQERSLQIESRISRLEKIVSLHKLARIGRADA